MRRLFKEATKIIEDDVRWLHDAAQRFEEIAHSLPKSQRASWILLTDMYDERADIHARLVAKMRQASHAGVRVTDREKIIQEAKTELERHVWGTFVERKASVALRRYGCTGCEACRKRFGANGQSDVNRHG